MQQTTKRLLNLVAGGALALALAACSAGAATPAPTDVDEKRATEIATSAMAAFNAGDYAGWSRDWSAEMKAAINEQAFLRFREQAMGGLGAYQSIEKAERVVKQEGTYRWVFTMKFEKGTATIGFGFKEGGVQVTGVFV
jgi:hypothetical protein